MYKNIGTEEMLNKLLFLGCLLHALVSEKALCTLYQCRQKHSGTGKKRPVGRVHKVRNQREITLQWLLEHKAE